MILGEVCLGENKTMMGEGKTPRIRLTFHPQEMMRYRMDSTHTYTRTRTHTTRHSSSGRHHSSSSARRHGLFL